MIGVRGAAESTVADEGARGVAGWRRFDGEHGIVLRIQVFANARAFAEERLERVDLVLNDRQLRSLARDLARAAEQRGLDLRAKRPWWRFWRSSRG